MKQIKYILPVFIISCNNPKEVDKNPYHPNIGITTKDLKRNGWEITSVDDGVCVSENEKQNPKLVFYMDMQENCKKVVAQELYIDLRYHDDDIQNLENNDFVISEKLNTEIDSILQTYNSKRISDFNKVAPCRLVFTGENEQKKKIEWDILNCYDKISMTTYSEL